MLLLFFPSGPGNINASHVIKEIWPPLNANSAADAVFWTESEMYEWFNEASRRLSGVGGVFVVRDTSLTSALYTRSYTLPANHQATIQADLAGAVLRPRNIQEVEALDADWPNTAGVPEAFLLDDAGGVTAITLYPQPNVDAATKTIGLVMRSVPADVSATAGLLAAPACLSDYFT